jgi:hypothetical protein
MGKRKRIGLFFTYNENWIGGSYYIINLIEALKLLPEQERPHITIFYYKALDKLSLVKALYYPYIDFKLVAPNKHIIKRAIRWAVKKIANKKIFTPGLVAKTPRNYYDAIFPVPFGFDHRLAKRTIYWIPDFQDRYLTKFFSPGELVNRRRFHLHIAASHDAIIFSSNDARNDFNKFYPVSTVQQHVVQFAVTHPPYDKVDFAGIASKYNLPKQYFFCPNQFWAHKNQQIILEAVRILNEAFNYRINVVFSGKTYDHRDANYFTNIKQYIKEHKLDENIAILGFIDREDQLSIMKNAVAVIQPSFFEGWSTVIEDAKSMNQNIIASNLPVHMEQLGNQAVYFDPSDANALANVIHSFARTNVEFYYDTARIAFGYNFLNVLNN